MTNFTYIHRENYIQILYIDGNIRLSLVVNEEIITKVNKREI